MEMLIGIGVTIVLGWAYIKQGEQGARIERAEKALQKVAEETKTVISGYEEEINKQVVIQVRLEEAQKACKEYAADMKKLYMEVGGCNYKIDLVYKEFLKRSEEILVMMSNTARSVDTGGVREIYEQLKSLQNENDRLKRREEGEQVVEEEQPEMIYTVEGKNNGKAATI